MFLNNIFNNFNDINIELIKLKNILNYEQPNKYIINNFNINGTTPVLTANKSFILGYTNENKNIYIDVPCIIFDDFTCEIKLVNFPFKIKSSAIKILKLKDKNNNLKYVFEYINSISFNFKDHKRYWISEFSNIKFPLINFDLQKRIGDFFTNIDKVIELLNKNLILINEYKSFLLNKIFNNFN